MALYSALFSGISGLNTLGNAMQIIGDNIANVNTVGFKGSTYSFQDLLSQSTATMSGTSQVGRGTALADISAVFAQGSFESTGNTTDLAIGGGGFFVVKEPGGADNLFYSRAGNFRLDQDGNLVNPEGYMVQGWLLDEDTGEALGSVTDITLTSFTSAPQETTNMEVIVNLDSDATDNTVSATPGDDTGLSELWLSNGSLPQTAYEYQTTMKVYDSLGSTHDVTVYFDPAETASTYEFIIACNATDDMRSGAAANELGLLARGTIEFNDSSGEIDDITLSQYDASAGSWVAQATATDLSNGYFTLMADFLGGTGTTQSMELDFGARYDGSSWVSGTLATTQFARASTTSFQSANGYGAGDLQGLEVDVDGIITGAYSNGELIPLFQVALANFQNLQGLHKEGNNLFSETRESGDAITGPPGTNGLGSIAPNSLEQSNVDIATEFVRMITTQRGFQANSKIITVTDQMLQDLINLKR